MNKKFLFLYNIICFFKFLSKQLNGLNKGMVRLFALFFYLFILGITVEAQNKAYLSGTLRDEDGNFMISASVAIKNSSLGTFTNSKGEFKLTVPSDQTLILVISHVGFKTTEDTIQLVNNETKIINKTLVQVSKQLGDVTVYGVQERENTLMRIDIKSIDQLPNSSGNLETILKTLPGVASGNELSSQYSVRGGSFDENLIYVNDIEIYRPLLVQSAIQEGLSFINPVMVSSIQFSAGGFDAQYGDKLSSVLDIKYKRATEFNGSVTGSLLGGSAHIEGISKNKRFSFNSGFRYKTTQYLLKTLDTKGDYKPKFADLQLFATYELTKKLDINFLGNYASNRFTRIPHDRSTDFGTFQQTYNLNAFYEGQEKDLFDVTLGAISVNYHPNDKLSMKLIGTVFNSYEEVTYDILTEYWIGQAVSGSSSRRDSIIDIGTGSVLEHARNFLTSNIYSLDYKGSFISSDGNWKWGLKGQIEKINDKINEWTLEDSAEYSLPYSDDSEVDLFRVVKAHNVLNTNRFSGFIQRTKEYSLTNSSLLFTLGVRSSYWTLNKELTVSPRGSLVIKPDNTPNLTWHISSGIYYQPPFYKELRDKYGIIYKSKKAQRSFQFVVGADYNFIAWDRPFVFTSEAYYKLLDRVIIYKLDDVKLQYMPEIDKTKGYAAGIDFKVYGEFVPGTESWFSLSFLTTKEDIYNDKIVYTDNTIKYPGYYRRPTDQFVNFSMFFQDYLPSNPNVKVHLMVIYGSGLPYSGPDGTNPSVTYKLGAYRRIDIGISRSLVRRENSKSLIKSAWISAEVMNILNIKNKVSYDWVRTIESQSNVDAYFAVPNYLTGRTLNFKLSLNF